MVINLSNPFIGTVAGGIVLMIIAGIVHYGITLIKFNFVNKKLGNVLSELDMLHRNHKKEIARIKEQHGNDITRYIEHALDIYDKKIANLISHNQPPPINVLAKKQKHT